MPGKPAKGDIATPAPVPVFAEGTSAQVQDASLFSTQGDIHTNSRYTQTGSNPRRQPQGTFLAPPSALSMSSQHPQYQGSFQPGSNFGRPSPILIKPKNDENAGTVSSLTPPPGKIRLIPLPKHYAAASSSKTERNRTARACDRCRKAKTKCSGGQPCEKCKIEGRDCIYGAGKRDKDRKALERLSKLAEHNAKLAQRNHDLTDILQNICSVYQLSPVHMRELEELILPLTPMTDDGDDLITNTSEGPTVSENRNLPNLGESDANADIGSTGSLDLMNEDTNRDANTRATGFMGKSSAVTRAQRARQQASRDIEHERDVGGNAGNAVDNAFTASAYHAEAADFPMVDTEAVNPLEWPPEATAKALIDSFFEFVYPSFPIIYKRDFMNTFNSFPINYLSSLSIQQQCWLSTLNLIFAIGAKLAHLTQSSHRGDDRDHLIYYARARALGMDQRTLNQDPDIQQTSCLGVLGLYLLVTDQLNKAWTITGLAVRHATVLGLHVRSEAKDLTDVDKELRVRLWWSLYSLEHLLDELTGRPSCISNQVISTPMPVNQDENDFRRDYPFYENRDAGTRPRITSAASLGSRTRQVRSISPVANSPPSFTFIYPLVPPAISSSTYLLCRTQLTAISHLVLEQLYSSTLINSKWGEVQEIMRNLDSQLVNWQRHLPEEFDFSPHSLFKEKDDRLLYRTGLSMFYYSSRMMLFRPCLCRFDGRIRNESDRSKDFNAHAVYTCVDSARHVIAALPSMEDTSRIYAITPFWATVHYVVQAASVLMLELAYRAQHVPSAAEAILSDSKKAVLWLRAMAEESIAARKSWEIFDNLLRIAAPKVGGETSDMPLTAPVPPSWGFSRFGSRPSGDREVAEREAIATGQPFANLAATSSWIDQSEYAQQQHSSDAPACTTAGVLSAEILATPHPLSLVYGRFDEFSPWQGVFVSRSDDPGPSYLNTTVYQQTANFPSTMGMNANGLLSMPMPYQQQMTGLEIGNYGNQYPRNDEMPLSGHGVSEYHQNWTSAGTKGDREASYGGEPRGMR